MKILYGVIGVVLCTISPIFSFFVSENNQKPGYVSVQNARSFTKTGFRAMQRRHFSGSVFKTQDNIVDSHFKVMKTAPFLQIPTIGNERRREIKVKSAKFYTESPKTLQQSDNVESLGTQPVPILKNQVGRQSDQNKMPQHVNNQQSRPQSRPHSPVNPDYLTQGLPRSYQSSHYVKETKPNFVTVNGHKALISTGPQKAVKKNKNNSRPQAALPIYRTEDKYQTKATPVAVDQNIPGILSNSDRSPKMTTRGDQGDNLRQKKQNKAEYTKRHADSKNYDASKAKRNVIFDTMRKYIVSKNKKINSERKISKEYSRIGIPEDNSIQAEDSPYAIFYRMHPESLDDQEDYIPMGVEEHAGVFSANKNKRLSDTLTNDIVDFRDMSKVNTKKVKLHKKVKNFANYRSILRFEHT